MDLQVLPRCRAASPTLIPAAKMNRLPAAAANLWPDLSPETQAQIAQIVAELLRRMLPMDKAPGREISGVDRHEQR